jgi:hypothetical protein
MIQDATALAEAQKNWAGVEALGVRLEVGAFASTGVLGGAFPFRLLDAAYNLPYIHAWSILNGVLLQFAIEGHFRHSSRSIKHLVRMSRPPVLPWQDYVLIKAGITDRNNVAHRGHLLNRDECQKYIAAIKSELQAWHIV